MGRIKQVPFDMFCTPFLLASLLVSQEPLLVQADLLSEKYYEQLAKFPPPSLLPELDRSLDRSIWFSIDVTHVKKTGELSILEEIGSDLFLNLLFDLGVQTLHLKNLKNKDSFFPKESFGDYASFYASLKKWGFTLVGEGMSSSNAPGKDFQMALENRGEYPSLFHLIEIKKEDWALLPKIRFGKTFANIPWLTLQELFKKGYIPEKSNPFTKKSDWNVTMPIYGADGKERRWIYLKEHENDPVYSWLSSSFGASRIASANCLNGFFELHESFLTLDQKLPDFAKETLSLWIRKLGAFSVEEVQGGVQAIKNGKSDLVFDDLTRVSLLHALIAEDVEALKIIYQVFLNENLETKRLVHTLQPFDRFSIDWSQVLTEPHKKYRYWQETITADALNRRLLKDDLYELGYYNQSEIPPLSWVDLCQKSLKIENIEEHREEIQKAHLLLALTYAFQPGTFSFSASDLLGAFQEGAFHLELTGVNPKTAYPSLPLQMKSPLSFASQLKQLLQIRKEGSLAKGKIIGVLSTKNPSCLLLLQKQFGTGMPLLLAVNFGRKEIVETIENSHFKNANAIELISHLSQEKPFESSHFSFSLPPLSGKLFLFQKKYYD